MKFTLQQKYAASHARAGELQTDHGTIRTPIFMPVGAAREHIIAGDFKTWKEQMVAKLGRKL